MHSTYRMQSCSAGSQHAYPELIACYDFTDRCQGLPAGLAAEWTHAAQEQPAGRSDSWTCHQKSRGLAATTGDGGAVLPSRYRPCLEGVDCQFWHLPRPTGLTGRVDRSGLYSSSRIRFFVKSPHVILLVKGYVFPGL